MNRRVRLAKLERASAPPGADTSVFRLCTAPEGLSAADHQAWHAERDERCFTLTLGDTQINTL